MADDRLVSRGIVVQSDSFIFDGGFLGATGTGTIVACSIPGPPASGERYVADRCPLDNSTTPKINNRIHVFSRRSFI